MKEITLKIDGKEIKAQIDESELAKLDEKGVRPPRVGHGERYYFISSTGSLGYDDEEGCSIDDYRYYSLNYFLTEEALHKRREYNEAIARINKYVIDNGMWFEPDWADAQQLKYCLYFATKGTWTFFSVHYARLDFQVLPYFRIWEHAEKVIKDCADDLEIVKNYHLKK